MLHHQSHQQPRVHDHDPFTVLVPWVRAGGEGDSDCRSNLYSCTEIPKDPRSTVPDIRNEDLLSTSCAYGAVVVYDTL